MSVSQINAELLSTWSLRQVSERRLFISSVLRVSFDKKKTVFVVIYPFGEASFNLFNTVCLANTRGYTFRPYSRMDPNIGLERTLMKRCLAWREEKCLQNKTSCLRCLICRCAYHTNWVRKWRVREPIIDRLHSSASNSKIHA